MHIVTVSANNILPLKIEVCVHESEQIYKPTCPLLFGVVHVYIGLR